MEDPSVTMLTVGLVVAVVLRDGEMAVEEEEDILVEAVEVIILTPAEEGEVLSMKEQINKTSVATTQLVMVM